MTRSLRLTISLATLLAVLFLARAVLAADAVFSGNLVHVAPGSISIKLGDGRVIEARLPKNGVLAATSIAAQYKLADYVEMTSKRIDAFFDPQKDHYYFLELKNLRSLRAGSPEEVAKVIATLSWKREDSLFTTPRVPEPKHEPELPETPANLEHVRAVNLENTAKLPSFVADEKATRSEARTGSSKWQLRDTVESEIVFEGNSATRQHVRINGKPWKSQSYWLPGVNWGIGFGTVLNPLFDADCRNTFEFRGQEQTHGKQLLVYLFHSPPDGCFGPGQVGPAQYNGPVAGRILVDNPRGNVLQLETEQQGSPVPEFPQVKQMLSWDYIKVGEASYLLPVAADYVFTYPTGDTWHIEVQYKNHRHFEISIDLRFGQTAEPVSEQIQPQP